MSQADTHLDVILSTGTWRGRKALAGKRSVPLDSFEPASPLDELQNQLRILAILGRSGR